MVIIHQEAADENHCLDDVSQALYGDGESRYLRTQLWPFVWNEKMDGQDKRRPLEPDVLPRLCRVSIARRSLDIMRTLTIDFCCPWGMQTTLKLPRLVYTAAYPDQLLFSIHPPSSLQDI